MAERIYLNKFYLIQRLNEKYRFTPEDYDYKQVNEIIYNEKSHFVATFKENLIVDDCSEFLKRFYMRKECLDRLPKITSFYEAYTKIFPNYTAIKESKFLYQNIRKKQMLINKENNDADGETLKAEVDEPVFNSEIKASIHKIKPFISNSALENSDVSIYRIVNSIVGGRNSRMVEPYSGSKDLNLKSSSNISLLTLRNDSIDCISTPKKSSKILNFHNLKVRKKKFEMIKPKIDPKQIAQPPSHSLHPTPTPNQNQQSKINYVSLISESLKDLYGSLTSTPLNNKNKKEISGGISNAQSNSNHPQTAKASNMLNTTPFTKSTTHKNLDLKSSNHKQTQENALSNFNELTNPMFLAKLGSQEKNVIIINSDIQHNDHKGNSVKGHSKGSLSCKILDKKIICNYPNIIIPNATTVFSINNNIYTSAEPMPNDTNVKIEDGQKSFSIEKKTSHKQIKSNPKNLRLDKNFISNTEVDIVNCGQVIRSTKSHSGQAAKPNHMIPKCEIKDMVEKIIVYSTKNKVNSSHKGMFCGSTPKEKVMTPLARSKLKVPVHPNPKISTNDPNKYFTPKNKRMNINIDKAVGCTNNLTSHFLVQSRECINQIYNSEAKTTHLETSECMNFFNNSIEKNKENPNSKAGVITSSNKTNESRFSKVSPSNKIIEKFNFRSPASQISTFLNIKQSKPSENNPTQVLKSVISSKKENQNTSTSNPKFKQSNSVRIIFII